MKRWIVITCLAAISALGILVPAAAQASTLTTGGKLTSGKPVKATITNPSQQIKYTFVATKNKNVTFNVTHFNFHSGGSTGTVYLYFYEPDSSSEYTDCGFSSNSWCNFTPPEGGTWKAVLIPSNSVGSLTLTFANDVPTQKFASGTPVATTIKYEGQQAGYTFAATKNKNVTFNVTHFNFTSNGGTGTVYLYFYEPGSSSEYTDCGFSSNGSCNFRTPVGGTWNVELIPSGSAVGSLTLTFANDVPTKALTAGKAVTTTIKFEGQDAGYSFATTKNKNDAFKVNHFNFTSDGGTGTVYLYFYEPGSSSEYTDCGFSSNGSCNFRTPVGGTWTITLIPSGSAVGSLTLTLN